MRENLKTFLEILEEKFKEGEKLENDSSTHRAKNTSFVNENFDFCCTSTLLMSTRKRLFRSKNSYIPSENVIQTLLEARLFNCKTEAQKSAVRFFFEMGARDFLINASQKLVTKSYRRLAMKLHPDKFAQKDVKTIEKQKKLFIELQKHYLVLKTLAKTL